MKDLESLPRTFRPFRPVVDGADSPTPALRLCQLPLQSGPVVGLPAATFANELPELIGTAQSALLKVQVGTEAVESRCRGPR